MMFSSLEQPMLDTRCQARTEGRGGNADGGNPGQISDLLNYPNRSLRSWQPFEELAEILCYGQHCPLMAGYKPLKQREKGGEE